jgi:type IV pilus assembly protein PilM
MSKSTPFLCLDIGTYSIHAGIFQKTDTGGLKLLRYTESIIEQNSSQETSPAALQEAVKTAINSLGVKSARLAFCVSGQIVFTRIVRLPATAPNQINRMIRFEAQQNVPFKIDEVVWDYQLLSGPTFSDLESIIVAIKSDILDQINDAVVAAGYLAEVVDVAPLAAYNALRFNYPTSEGCQLLIDIGARSTQLVFSEAGRVFVRGVPIAGHQITQAISQDLKENYQSSELLKIGKGFVGLGGGYEDPPDETAARISKITRSVMTRLHAEIVRSISYYRTQHGGSTPSGVFLAGGSSSLSYMDLFFKEKLSTTVEYFNPLKNIEIDSSLDQDALRLSAHRMGCIVGLATRFTASTPIEINLVPLSVKNKLDARKRSSLIALVSLILLLAFGVPILSNAIENAARNLELEALTNEVAKRGQLQKRLAALETKFQAITDEANQIKQIINEKQRWVKLLNFINEKAVVGMWVTKIQPQSKNTPSDFLPIQVVETRTAGQRTLQVDTGSGVIDSLLIQGFYESYDIADVVEGSESLGATGESRVAEFVNNLVGSDSPFSTTREEIETNPARFTRTVDNIGNINIALPFSVTLDLREPIRLVP